MERRIGEGGKHRPVTGSKPRPALARLSVEPSKKPSSLPRQVGKIESSDPFWQLIGSSLGAVRAAGASVVRAMLRRNIHVSQGEAESTVLELAVKVFESFEGQDGATVGGVLKFAKLRAVKHLTRLHGRDILSPDLSEAPVVSRDEGPDFFIEEFLVQLTPFDRWVVESRLKGATWVAVAQAACANEGRKFFPSSVTKLKGRVARRLCPLLMRFFAGPSQPRLVNILAGILGDGHTVGKRRPLPPDRVREVLDGMRNLHVFDKWVLDNRLTGTSWADIAKAANSEGDLLDFKNRVARRLRKSFRASPSIPRRDAARLLDMVMK